MTSKICTVRDRATDTYGQPIFVQAIGQAIRSFGDEINRKDSQLGLHPEDYDLYVIGEYDERTGFIKSEQPRQIAIGKEQINPIE